jgi:hypothetical protein
VCFILLYFCLFLFTLLAFFSLHNLNLTVWPEYSMDCWCSECKKEHFGERENQEKCCRGGGAWKRIWMRLDGMLAQPKTKAPGNLSPRSNSSRVCSCTCQWGEFGITLGWRSTLPANHFTFRWTTNGIVLAGSFSVSGRL